eukprot:1804325-Pyramimonas_sp.AAC.1
MATREKRAMHQWHKFRASAEKKTARHGNSISQFMLAFGFSCRDHLLRDMPVQSRADANLASARAERPFDHLLHASFPPGVR